MIVPNTNNDKTQEELAARYPNTTFHSSDWLELHNNDPFIGKGVLVECEAGDLILWDSRSVHGGQVCDPNE
jgi:ectoine hydroxylase-related dioxygenase (phytanoyl-CoA dioxygenase family)